MLFKSHPAASLKEIKKHLWLAIHGHVISDIKKQTFHKPERKFKKNEYCQSQMKEDLEGTCQWQGGGNLTATRRRELNSDKAEGTWQWQGGGNLTVTRRRELDSDKAEGTWQWQGGGNLTMTRRCIKNIESTSIRACQLSSPGGVEQVYKDHQNIVWFWQNLSQSRTLYVTLYQ